VTAHVVAPDLDDDELFRLAGRRPAIDLLTEAIERVRTQLMRADRLPQRVRIFCAGLKACRDLGASDVVIDEFRVLATDVGLLDQLAHEQPPPPDSYVVAADVLNHLIRITFLDSSI
jgi:hypothetical protein